MAHDDDYYQDRGGNYIMQRPNILVITRTAAEQKRRRCWLVTFWLSNSAIILAALALPNPFQFL